MVLASDGATAEKIQELKGLMSRQPIDHKRAPVEEVILKLLVYGDQQMPATQVGIGKTRPSLKDFVKRQKGGINSRRRIISAKR